MTVARQPSVLVTIPISHYCERARWALDHAGVPYRERAHIQLVHWVAARRAGGGRTVPVLVSDKAVLPESAEIVRFADERAPAQRKLYPPSPERAAGVRALEQDYDARLGPHGRRWMYHRLRGRRDLALAYGCAGVPGWERLALRVGYPLAIRVIDRVLDISEATAVESERQVRAAFDDTARRLADGRPYLAGDGFTAADLTFSALAASVLMPPQYGVALPQPDELPPPACRLVQELRAHPAGAHALAMYRDHRRQHGGSQSHL